MNSRYKIHLAVSITINILLVFKMINLAWNGNDKAIGILIFIYLLLIVINALMW